MIHQMNIYGKDRVQQAIERLQTFEPEEGYYLAFSGGKDSVFDMTAMKVSDIRSLLKKKYAGQEKSFNEIIDEIIDDTPYLEKNIRATIKSMEKDSEVRITRITSKPSGKGLQQEDRIFFNQETQMSLF